MNHEPEPEPSFAEIEQLFYRAMDVPAMERASYIADSAKGNATLHREVLSLVEAVSAADRLLTHPPHPDKPGGASSSPPGSLTGQQLGAFHLDRLLGQGGMGEVYAGHRVGSGLEQAVAVKVIAARLDSPALRAIFFRERDALAKLLHPRIAKLLDGGVTSGDAPYLVMELVGEEGAPAQRLDDFCDGKNLNARERVSLILELCDAVSYAHQKLIVHGDLKPGNVLVSDSGEVKLVDFGAARLLVNEASASGPAALTPAYASPEQMEGSPITVSSDIYSTGRLLERILGNNIDEELRAVVRKATENEPDQRYSIMALMAADLRDWLAGRPLRAYSTRPAYVAQKWLKRNRLSVGVSAVVLALLAVCIFQMQRSARQALAERDRADRSTSDVEGLAHKLLFDFQEQLSNMGSSTEAQHRLANITLNYLNELSSQPGVGSDALKLDVVNAYTRMGNLLGNPYDENLGQPKEGEAALEKAIQAATQLVAREPANKDARFDLAMAQRSLAEVQFGAGDTKSAVPVMTEAIKNFQSLAAASDAPSRVLEEAASAEGTLGDIYGMPGAGSLENTSEAINCYRQQTALSERALKLNPSDPRAGRAVAVSMYKIANIVIDKDPNAAVAGYRQAMAAISRLPQTAPTLRLLNGVEGHLVRAYTALGKTTEALAAMQTANQHAAQMAANDPQDDRAQFDLATSDVTLAHALLAAGKREEARQSLHNSLHILEAMIKHDPDNHVIKEHRQDVEDDLAKLDRKAAR